MARDTCSTARQDGVYVDKSLVQGMMDGGLSYKKISAELGGLYPGVTRGLSERSVRRYVLKNNMHAVSKHHKLEAVQKAVSEVSNEPEAVYLNMRNS